MTFNLKNDSFYEPLKRSSICLNALAYLLDPDQMTPIEDPTRQNVEGEEILEIIQNAQHSLNVCKKNLSKVTKKILKSTS